MSKLKRLGQTGAAKIVATQQGNCALPILKSLLFRQCAKAAKFSFVLFAKSLGGAKVNFALEILEADQLDEDYQSPARTAGSVWRMGIEIDRFGRALNYAFLSRHPGDTAFPTQAKERRHIIVPAKDVVHLFDRASGRPGQTRGVPWLSSGMQRMHHLDGWEQASVVRARASSALMGFITSPEGELDPGGEVYDNERVSGFEPGQFKYLQPGESVSIQTWIRQRRVRTIPQSAAQGVGFWGRMQLRDD